MITRLIVVLVLAVTMPCAVHAQVQVAQVQIQESTVRVHVTGSVARPGVYTLPRGSRGVDAIQAAGGSTKGAALSELNLASVLEDGERLDVPRVGASAAVKKPSRAVARAARRPSDSRAPRGRISLNTATLDELDSLPGVGPGLARDILRYRQEKGRFRSLEELKEVPGIGDRRFERLSPQLTL